jgi:hypothetical protein
MVNPVSGRLFVISKSASGGQVFRAPKKLSATTPNVLERVADGPARVTGASFAPDGGSFVLATYDAAYVYAEVGGTATRVTVPATYQGESVEVNRGGGAFYVGSEGPDSPVYRVPLP